MKKINDYYIKYSTQIAVLDLEILIASAIKKDRAFVISNPQYILSHAQQKRLNTYIKQRLANVPVAYILGYKEFCGLNFLVDKNVLVPRPETELIVDEVVEFTANSSQPIVLIDVGTGSGCIPIGIVKKLILKHESTNKLINKLTIYAIDISTKALTVAKKNAKKHGVKIKFLHGNLLKPILSLQAKRSNLMADKKMMGLPRRHCVAPRNDITIITANLPYLTKKEFAAEPSISREPKMALVADNKHGLSLYEKLLKQIKTLRRTIKHRPLTIDQTRDRSPITVLLEINPSQTKPISAIIKKILPTAKAEIIKDLSGKNRLVKISW